MLSVWTIPLGIMAFFAGLTSLMVVMAYDVYRKENGTRVDRRYKHLQRMETLRQQAVAAKADQENERLVLQTRLKLATRRPPKDGEAVTNEAVQNLQELQARYQEAESG